MRALQRPLIDTALELDPASGTAHALLAAMTADSDEADARFRKAIELAPNAATMRLAYARFLLLRVGRFEAAEEIIRKAAQLDPLSPVIRYNQAKAVWSVGRAERAVAAEPGNTYRVNQLIFAYQSAADFEQALSFFKTAYPDIHAGRKATNALTTWPTLVVAAGACTLDRQQLCERLLAMAEQGLADHRLILGGGFLIGTEQMQIHAIRGERAATIAEFRRIVDAGWRFLWTFIQYQPAFATYLDDPEFAGILAEVEADIAAQRKRYYANPDQPLY